MMNNILLVLVSSAVFFLACTRKTENPAPESGEVIVVDGENIADSADISDWISDVKITLLKETDGNYIGEVDKLLLHNGHFIVLDKYVGNQILVFDSTGTSIPNEMGKLGKGPEELRQLNDIWVTEDNGIEVYDFSLKKIITYDKNYEFVSYRNAADPAIFQSVCPLPGSNEYAGFAGYGSNLPFEGQYYKLAFLHKDFGIDRVTFPYDNLLTGALVTTPVSPFLRMNDSVRFFQNFDPVIYSISAGKGIEKRYRLDYRPHPFPEDFEHSIIAENISLFRQQAADFEKVRELYHGFWGFGGGWLETDHYVIFDSFDDEFNSFVSLYDKRIGTIIAQGRFFTGTTKHDVILPPAFTSQSGEDRFVAIFGGYIIKNLVGEKSPFYNLVNEYPDRNFVFEFTLK